MDLTIFTRSPLVDVKVGLKIPILSSSDNQRNKNRSFSNEYMNDKIPYIKTIIDNYDNIQTKKEFFELIKVL